MVESIINLVGGKNFSKRSVLPYDNNICDLFNATDKRHKALEITSRLVYAVFAYTKGLKIDPKQYAVIDLDNENIPNKSL